MFHDAHPTEGNPPNFKGSVMVFRAATEAEVREILSNDVYGKGNVWDLEKTQIIPVSPPPPFVGCREVGIGMMLILCRLLLLFEHDHSCILDCSRVRSCHMKGEEISRCITC
jgi:hypothetical protein